MAVSVSSPSATAREPDQDEGIHVEVIARLVVDLAREAGGEERQDDEPRQEQGARAAAIGAEADEHRGEGDQNDQRHHRPAGEEPGQDSLGHRRVAAEHLRDRTRSAKAGVAGRGLEDQESAPEDGEHQAAGEGRPERTPSDGSGCSREEDHEDRYGREGEPDQVGEREGEDDERAQAQEPLARTDEPR
jgi:hypothetical protein